MKKIVPPDAVLIPDGAKKVFDGVIFDVWQWEQTLFDGSSGAFEMLKRLDTTSALCIVDGKILVLHDEQPHRGTLLSFPGGRRDVGEPVDDAARREALEETGYEFANWKLVQVKQFYKKIEYFTYTYIAWDVTGTHETNHDAGERITVDHLEFERVKELSVAHTGHLGDAADFISDLSSVDELIELPEYKGREVVRPD